MLTFWSHEGVVFSSCYVFSPPLSGFNWRSLTPLGGPGPFTSKMASLSTGSAHTPSPGFRTITFHKCVFNIQKEHPTSIKLLISLVLLTPVKHRNNWITRQLFENCRNHSRACLLEPGGAVWWKKPDVKNLVTLSLSDRFSRAGWQHVLVFLCERVYLPICLHVYLHSCW
jgi:hypothetical protein